MSLNKRHVELQCASSVWDSGKPLETVLGFVRAVVLRAWAPASSNITWKLYRNAKFWTPPLTQETGSGGGGGEWPAFCVLGSPHVSV